MRRKVLSFLSPHHSASICQNNRLLRGFFLEGSLTLDSLYHSQLLRAWCIPDITFARLSA